MGTSGTRGDWEESKAEETSTLCRELGTQIWKSDFAVVGRCQQFQPSSRMTQLALDVAQRTQQQTLTSWEASRGNSSIISEMGWQMLNSDSAWHGNRTSLFTKHSGHLESEHSDPTPRSSNQEASVCTGWDRWQGEHPGVQMLSPTELSYPAQTQPSSQSPTASPGQCR